MKKVLLVLGALLVTLSGVAMVSAYEAHVINVTAHVENALFVDRTPLSFGTVFPEEWFIKEIYLTTSSSFCATEQQTRHRIHYSIHAGWKAIHGTDPVEYYHWLGEALYVGVDVTDPRPESLGGQLVNVGAPPASKPGTKPTGVSAIIDKRSAGNQWDYIMVALDVPVFEGYWNEHTDVATKPSGLDGPTYVIPEFLPGGAPNPAWNPDGTDLGLDIIIQITKIDTGTVIPPTP